MVAYQRVFGHESKSSTTREDIVALYSVKNVSETPQDKTLVLNLALNESSPEEDKPTKRGKCNIYFDQHRGQVVTTWADGSTEEAATERGEDGFLVGNSRMGPPSHRKCQMYAVSCQQHVSLPRDKAKWWEDKNWEG